MTDQDQQPAVSQRETPTEKMLAWAETVASRLGETLPDKVRKSFDACRDWLDARPTIPPSEKQVAYAERIAEQSGIDLPDGALSDYKVMKAWLDEHAGNH